MVRSLNVNGELTSSKVLVNAPNPTDDFFLLKSGSLDSLKVNNQGVLTLGGFTLTPTAVRGGLYYDHDDDDLLLLLLLFLTFLSFFFPLSFFADESYGGQVCARSRTSVLGGPTTRFV